MWLVQTSQQGAGNATKTARCKYGWHSAGDVRCLSDNDRACGAPDSTAGCHAMGCSDLVGHRLSHVRTSCQNDGDRVSRFSWFAPQILWHGPTLSGNPAEYSLSRLGLFPLGSFSQASRPSRRNRRCRRLFSPSHLSDLATSPTMRTPWERSWYVNSPKNRSLFSVIFKTTLLNVAASSCRPPSLGDSAHIHVENMFQDLQLLATKVATRQKYHRVVTQALPEKGRPTLNHSRTRSNNFGVS